MLKFECNFPVSFRSRINEAVEQAPAVRNQISPETMKEWPKVMRMLITKEKRRFVFEGVQYFSHYYYENNISYP